MEDFKFRIIESLIVVLVLTVTLLSTKKAINKSLIKFDFGIQRRKIAVKIINFIIIISGTIFLIAIWGIDQKEIVLFISSVMTVIGIAFFCPMVITLKRYCQLDFIF